MFIKPFYFPLRGNYFPTNHLGRLFHRIVTRKYIAAPLNIVVVIRCLFGTDTFAVFSLANPVYIVVTRERYQRK